MSWPTAEQFDKAAELGTNYALAERRNGNEGPQESPLNGEWADNPTEYTIAQAVGFTVTADEAGDLMSAHNELADAWERGYFDTWAHEDDVQAEEDGEAG